jgi:exosortase J
MPEQLELLAPNIEEVLEPEERSRRAISARLALWSGMALLTAAGCLGIHHELAFLWFTWTTDPLRSIGLLIPPASIMLTLRAWRHTGWEMRGTWWGLLAIGLSYFLSLLRQQIQLFAVSGQIEISFIPTSLPIYLYGSGVVLLFFGPRVWRKAWFPLGLLLLSQPVPVLSTTLIDIPLQNISARVARSFATLIGFTPTSSQLQLMFAPDFGMFIAPGCDGIRGAVAMGYVALVLGYIKRVSFRRWAAYVTGAVIMGYLFNFIRLCTLVLYYRIALGHSALQNVAGQADYAIGSCLFLIAVLLFLWAARQKQEKPIPEEGAISGGLPTTGMRNLFIKGAAFTILSFIVLSLPSSALRSNHMSPLSQPSLVGRMPKQIGEFALTQIWNERDARMVVIEAGGYSAPRSDKITLGVWVASANHFHNANACWLARGLQPESLANRSFVAAGGKPVEFSTGFYSDGVTDSIVANATCTPQSCSDSKQIALIGPNTEIVLLKPNLDHLGVSKGHPVSIMIRIDRPHSNSPQPIRLDSLTAEAKRFVSGLDLESLSRAFQ